MLKLLPSSSFGGNPSAKCGEIYCHSSTEFTIVCSLCGLKAFHYEDFLLHCKNVHFENDLLRTEEVLLEVTPYLAANVKDELLIEENSDDVEFMEVNDFDISDAEDEKAGLRIMKWEQKQALFESLETGTQNDEEDNYDRDQDFSPTSHKKKLKEIKRVRTETYKCEICSRTYKSKHNLRLHLQKAHSPEGGKTLAIQMQKCEECAEEFKTLRSLEDHCLTVHGGMKCSLCERRLTSRTNQLRHIETHTHGTERRFACDYENCTKRFFTRRQYQAHKRIHTRAKNFICDICGYSCRVPEMLKVHYRSHTGEKPYACEECGKRFISKSAVREHKVTHGTERPHVCKVCDRSFAHAKSLYHHKFLHLEEKKFKCKVCGQAYAQLAGLAGHMRRHREDGEC
ncbi:zinc finger protein 91-like [Rhagoletis pomonella]|uniref:zinc finger protein 91-like n=1 Tax=Rhagoletis pomonella TaxID=28610 RepID=UPI00177CEE14|nr:zinc finger protein 91-like [Rhagoletis pomonella]